MPPKHREKAGHTLSLAALLGGWNLSNDAGKKHHCEKKQSFAAWMNR
jgi:hypothetical protein